MTWEIRHAATEDLPEVVGLLQEASLPTAGVVDHFPTFLVAVASGKVIGVIGLEPYGESALLRSAVVDRAWRKSGVGTALVDYLEAVARGGGACKLVLLTTTADRYFRRKGYRVISRTQVTGPITRSAEFTGACPETAVIMEKPLCTPLREDTAGPPR